MILACQNVCKSFGTDDILKNVSFHIEEKEKMALVGINGAGKTTLIKIIMGEETKDSGNIVISKDKTIGYLAQHQNKEFENTIYGEMLEAKKEVIELDKTMHDIENNMKHLDGEELETAMKQYANATHRFEMLNGYAYKSEIVGVIKGLGFGEDDYDRYVKTLSGGQKTRVALGKLLLSKPDIIILDEPTNHLDMESITWLEGYLSSYDGAVIIVSHDRYFLDKIVTKVVELDRGESSMYLGNYTQYSTKRAMQREAMMKAYLNQQREIKHQEEVITKLKSFNREKSIKRAESREKMLDKIEVLDKPTEVNDEMRISLTPQVESGTDVLLVEELKKAFDNKVLFENLTLDIKRGERVALIGNNGTGKTTILKIINKYIPKDGGRVILGSRVKIGYYDQEHQVLSTDKTIFDEISDAYPNLGNTKIRNVLAAFLFTGDDVYKRIGDLSGGERGRASLAKLMLSSANLLILDEPTNHLDVTSKEILEQALTHYTGTILFVSHDRYFINQTATRIVDLVDGKLYNYKGNYDYYMEKKVAVKLEVKEDADADTDSESSNKIDWKKNKEEQAKLRKKENDIKKTEDSIEATEMEISNLDEMLNDSKVATDVSKLMEISNKKQELEDKLEKLYEQWDMLNA